MEEVSVLNNDIPKHEWQYDYEFSLLMGMWLSWFMDWILFIWFYVIIQLWQISVVGSYMKQDYIYSSRRLMIWTHCP